MADNRKQAAKQFVENWKDRSSEKSDSQSFWLDLLRDVYGIDHPAQFIFFEEEVLMDHTSFIDGMIPSTRVLVEQKSKKKKLSDPIEQSDGTMLTPFQQAKRYITELPVSKHPRWVVTCNFAEFWVYDMEDPAGEPQKIRLEDLPDEYYRLQFLVDPGNKHTRREADIAVSKTAGEIVAKLYNAFAKQFKDPESEQAMHSLNVLCVRLVFCLYAENSGLFGRYGLFHDYMEMYEPWQMREALEKLFEVLDTPEDERNPYQMEDTPLLAEFPYVNGGLFSDTGVRIPSFTDEIRDILLDEASAGFNWSDINPTIFGAMFESTLNPETRRSGGMHYTSVENIHKVIDPLFLDGLREEFDDLKNMKTRKKDGTVNRVRYDEKMDYLNAFQEKLTSLRFLDPACGSGNFLTETYLSLRRLENEVIREKDEYRKGTTPGQFQLSFLDEEDDFDAIKVSISQFYGIEYNDFAVRVAQAALWIAEHQMMEETREILHNGRTVDFLPLKTKANIVQGNALTTDWADFIPKHKLSYIMGNPPFVGLSLRTEAQKEDMALVFKDNDRAGRLDYVAAWYEKTAQYMSGTRIQAAFVSTNSIVQGEQVPVLWKDLFGKGIKINFAYRTFVWDNEAKDKAAVHCVIIGFGCEDRQPKVLFDGDRKLYVDRINGYLVNADNIFIQSRGKPAPGMPKLVQGNKPWDGGNLILSPKERDELIRKHPEAEHLIRRYVGSHDFINNKVRYCLWLKDVPPDEYRHIPEIMGRLGAVAEVRRKTKTAAVRAQADTPMLFSQIRQPDSDYILIPETSSANRQYIPMGFMDRSVIASNSTLVATGATLYLFGILTSNVHMGWTRTVCGRLKSDYRYSPAVYNNFPWPNPTPEQKAKIEQTAQAVLDARALYPDSSLADLYDELTMPPDLRRAHQMNDRAVMEAYGFTKGTEAYTSEAALVAELMNMYQRSTGK